MAVIRIWQANIQKTIIAHVPVTNGQVQETGDFELDGVTFPAAEIVLEFMDPSDDGDEGGSMFPTGKLVDDLVQVRHKGETTFMRPEQVTPAGLGRRRLAPPVLQQVGDDHRREHA